MGVYQILLIGIPKKNGSQKRRVLFKEINERFVIRGGKIMIRGYMGKGFGLPIAELKNKKTKTHKYVNPETGDVITEYWVYKTPKFTTGFFDANNKPIYRYDSQSYLFCIIVCDNDRLKICEDDKLLFVEGVRFTGKDINEYLRTTNRPAQDNIMRDEYGDDNDRPDKPLNMKRVDPDGKI